MVTPFHMSKTMYEELINFIIKVSSKLSLCNPKSISNKEKDIKLSEDLIINDIIYQYLDENYSFPILTEEDKGAKLFSDFNDYYWILDPIDGSLNYFRDIPFSCISLSLWNKMKPMMGLVYDFWRDELFFSTNYDSEMGIERRAFLNDKTIKVSNIKSMREGIISTGFSSGRNYSNQSINKFTKKVQEWKKVRLFGSAALSLAWVASGRLDAYMEDDIYFWDVAAGLALVEVAGGSIFLRANRQQSNQVFASATNGRIPINELTGLKPEMNELIIG